jgi:hypothetical protein
MPDVDVLRELTAQFQRPGYDDLVAVARQRRRRSVLAATAGVAVVVLAVGVVAAGLADGRHAQEPAPQPSPTLADSTAASEGWTPERTRDEGAAVDFLGSGPSGIDTQLYCLADAKSPDSPCDRYHPYNLEEDQHWAIEVTQGGRSAVFDVQGTPLAKDFDDDSILVEDGAEGAVRLRLLRADGTAVPLRVVDGLAPAAPGPDVTLIQDLDVYRSGMIGPDDGTAEQPYLVDPEAGTLQLLDVPQEIKWWGPNVHEFLWGGNGCRVFWQQPDGSFDDHDADCGKTRNWLTDPGWNFAGFENWVAPGRLALAEYGSSGEAQAAHVSLDYGHTWQRIAVENPDPDRLTSWTAVTHQIR